MIKLPRSNIDKWSPNEKRYEKMQYRRCGKSGVLLPVISLGLWHNFGETTDHLTKRRLCQTAFDLGITHFDLANNYGPPPGAAETALGEILRTDFVGLRDELLISTKAGYDMWCGPYGEFSSRKYLISSLDKSLKRLGLDYVDIFYSHRFDPKTPLEETMGALDFAVRSGRALYAGISSYNSHYTREAAAILKNLGTPCLIHQPSYSMVNRWVEQDDLFSTLDDLSIGSIAFTPLAQGLLTNKYLKTIPTEGRADSSQDVVKQAKILAPALNKLNILARKRGQSLAQMALAWALRGSLTSALIGASKPEQIIDNVGALKQAKFTNAELVKIDQLTADPPEVNASNWINSFKGRDAK